MHSESDDEKIKTIDQLAQTTTALREAGKCVVHCHGVFDLLHIGHIRYLQEAAKLGDVLAVTVTPDRFVNKGPHRPAFGEQLRVAALAALDCVDFAAINQWPTAVETISRLRPNIFAKGAEFRDAKTPELLREEEAASAAGAEVRYIEAFTSSSSKLINQHLSPFSEDVTNYLRGLRQQYSAEEILAPLAEARKHKVLVVGETLIDEYYACSAIGQSANAPVVATRYQSHERFAGGALAVANHIAAFCDQVELISIVGEQAGSPDSTSGDESWLRRQLRPHVGAFFLEKHASPTIIKRRYRESYFGSPLLEVNFLNDQPLSEEENKALCDQLADRLQDFELVVVADYGHGMLGEKAVQLLCENSKFLAVTTQANAANWGFHLISKYPRADFVSLSERELQLENHHRGELRPMLQSTGQKLYAQTVVATLGKRGCESYHRRGGFHWAPAVATQVVDRIGAGEAFYAITSLCAAADGPPPILAFLGNVAGAQAVAVLGNSSYLDELAFSRNVESLLK